MCDYDHKKLVILGFFDWHQNKRNIQENAAGKPFLHMIDVPEVAILHQFVRSRSVRDPGSFFLLFSPHFSSP